MSNKSCTDWLSQLQTNITDIYLKQTTVEHHLFSITQENLLYIITYEHKRLVAKNQQFNEVSRPIIGNFPITNIYSG